MKSDFNFEELKTKIESATKNSFKENIKKYGTDICSFSLTSDDGAMTVIPYTNTKSHLEKKQLEDPKYKEYYEFETCEWYTSDGANIEFNAICKMISEEIDKVELDFENFRNKLFETCIQVLEKLQNENFFLKELGHDLLIKFSISDTTEPKKNLIEWTKRLNNGELGNRYESYMNFENK